LRSQPGLASRITRSPSLRSPPLVAITTESRAVAAAALASDAGVQAYEWFGLRDGNTAATWTARFGILRDGYTPKPAFAAIQQIIVGQRHAAPTPGHDEPVASSTESAQ
jgi:hypothetical protein